MKITLDDGTEITPADIQSITLGERERLIVTVPHMSPGEAKHLGAQLRELFGVPRGRILISPPEITFAKVSGDVGNTWEDGGEPAAVENGASAAT